MSCFVAKDMRDKSRITSVWSIHHIGNNKHHKVRRLLISYTKCTIYNASENSAFWIVLLVTALLVTVLMVSVLVVTLLSGSSVESTS